MDDSIIKRNYWFSTFKLQRTAFTKSNTKNCYRNIRDTISQINNQISNVSRTNPHTHRILFKSFIQNTNATYTSMKIDLHGTWTLTKLNSMYNKIYNIQSASKYWSIPFYIFYHSYEYSFRALFHRLSCWFACYILFVRLFVIIARLFAPTQTNQKTAYIYIIFKFMTYLRKIIGNISVLHILNSIGRWHHGASFVLCAMPIPLEGHVTVHATRANVYAQPEKKQECSRYLVSFVYVSIYPICAT